MYEEFSTENLNVGDKVIVHLSGYGFSSADYIGIIEKKTPTGLVDVRYNEKAVERFKRDGRAYAKENKYSRCSTRLECYSEEKGEKIINENTRRSLVGYIEKVDFSKMSLEDLSRVYELVKEIQGKAGGYRDNVWRKNGHTA